MRALLLILGCFFGVCLCAQRHSTCRFLQPEDSVMQASGNIPTFTIYKDNYLITGTNFSGGRITKNNSDVKFQVSLRHRLSRNLLPYKVYMFLTYTQKSFWDVYRNSMPFKESNYNPTFGFGRNFIYEGRIAGIGMLQFEHESNGRDSIFSRSWNRITFTGIYHLTCNYTVQAKLWIPMIVSSYNKDVTRYMGIGHLGVTYTSNNERFACSALMVKRGGWNFNANWQLQIAYRLFRQNNQFLCLQFYDGYGERMIDYNRFSRYVRVGFVIKPGQGSIL